jgi:lysophospholipase L1-like esterase
VRPRATVLLIGTNDIANGIADEEIIGAIRMMILHARGGRTIVCGLLPSSGEGARSRPAERILSLNMKLHALAQELEVEYVDLHSVLRDELNGFASAYTTDGLHPSQQGYVRMTQALLPALLQERADEGHGVTPR